jgi:hypothetical protein
VAIAVAAFALLQWWKISPWLVVFLSALAGFLNQRWLLVH